MEQNEMDKRLRELETENGELRALNNKQSETIESNDELIAAFVKSGSEMSKEIIALKSKIGGYKASNAAYRKRIDEYKAKLKEWENKYNKAMDYGKEADELNENKVAMIDGLKKQVANLEKCLNYTEEALVDAATAKESQKGLLKKGWYRRVFKKG